MDIDFNKGVIAIVMLIGIYAFAFWNSMRKIDNFCDSVSASTKVSELKTLAQKAGVDLRGPMRMSSYSGKGGEYVYAIAASAFTVGEYACSIHAESISGTVKSKRLGY